LGKGDTDFFLMKLDLYKEGLLGTKSKRGVR